MNFFRDPCELCRALPASIGAATAADTPRPCSTSPLPPIVPIRLRRPTFLPTAAVDEMSATVNEGEAEKAQKEREKREDEEGNASVVAATALMLEELKAAIDDTTGASIHGMKLCVEEVGVSAGVAAVGEVVDKENRER